MADFTQDKLKQALVTGQPPYKPPKQTYTKALLDALMGIKPQEDKKLPVAILGVRG